MLAIAMFKIIMYTMKAIYKKSNRCFYTAIYIWILYSNAQKL